MTTPRVQAIADAVRVLYRRTGVPPTFREVAEYCELKSVGSMAVPVYRAISEGLIAQAGAKHASRGLLPVTPGECKLCGHLELGVPGRILCATGVDE